MITSLARVSRINVPEIKSILDQLQVPAEIALLTVNRHTHPGDNSFVIVITEDESGSDEDLATEKKIMLAVLSGNTDPVRSLFVEDRVGCAYLREAIYGALLATKTE